MLSNQLKFSAILCSALLLVSCGGGGSDTSTDTTTPTANDSDSTSPNQKVLTEENADINDAEVVEDGIESMLTSQTANSLSNTATTSAKYRQLQAITTSRDCAHGGSMSFETSYSLDGSGSMSSTFTQCSVSDYLTMNGTFTSTTDASNLNAITTVQEYTSDFTITMPEGLLTIYEGSKFNNSVESGAGVYGEAKVTTLFTSHTKFNNNETIFKDFTMESEAVLTYNEVRICLKEGAIYSSMAPTANPFLIDTSFDPNCDYRFIVNVLTNEISSGEVRYYIGSHKFRTYAFGGELQTERVSN
jgi:hypothetical protein